MMRAIVLFLKIAVVVAIAVWLAERPGAVTIDWQDWRIDTTVGVLALIVVAFAVAVALLYRLWGYLRQAPRRIGAARRSSRQRRGYKALSQGMVAVAAGDAAEAQRQARRAGKLLDEPPLTMLLSAQAAQLNGDETAARRYFEAMLEKDDTAFLGIRGLLTQALKAGDDAEALRLARRAHRLRPDAAWALTQLLALQVAGERWEEAEWTLSEAVRHKALPAADARLQQAAILVERSRLALAEEDVTRAADFARRAHDLAPGLVPATALHARLAARTGKERRARKVLEAAWSAAPHPELAEAYADIDGALAPLDRVKRMQRLCSFRPDHPESHFALAAAALDADLWGEARTHLSRAQEAQKEAGPTVRVCRMMAELEEAQHGDIAAVRDWLERTATAEPDDAWVCTDCGAVAGTWSARCGNCGAFNALRWQRPPRVVRLAKPPEGPALAPPEPAEEGEPSHIAADTAPPALPRQEQAQARKGAA